MKKIAVSLLVVIMMFTGTGLHAEGGGVIPCLASCLVGPRVGLEMNEGKEIQKSEWIGVIGGYFGNVVPIVGSLVSLGCRGYMAYDMGYVPNGFEGFAASFCLGPRIGNELDTRKIRTKEWLRLVPCICIYPAIAIPLEAYNGKTMTEIEQKEGLRK